MRFLGIWQWPKSEEIITIMSFSTRKPYLCYRLSVGSTKAPTLMNVNLKHTGTTSATDVSIKRKNRVVHNGRGANGNIWRVLSTTTLLERSVRGLYPPGSAGWGSSQSVFGRHRYNARAAYDDRHRINRVDSE